MLINSFSLATPCPLHLMLVNTCMSSRHLIFKRCLERVLLSHSQNSPKPLHQKIYKIMFWVYEKWALGDTMIIWCINISLKTFTEVQCRNNSVGSSAKKPKAFAETTKNRQKLEVGEGRRIASQWAFIYLAFAPTVVKEWGSESHMV